MTNELAIVLFVLWQQFQTDSCYLLPTWKQQLLYCNLSHVCIYHIGHWLNVNNVCRCMFLLIAKAPFYCVVSFQCTYLQTAQ